MLLAQKILEQLGGRRFIAMTGAKNFVAGPTGDLTFKIGRNAGNISHVKISLTPEDTYTMEFLKVRFGDVVVAKQYDGVYFDQLQPIFTEVTGMYTRLF